jgi:hypothetical protein
LYEDYLSEDDISNAEDTLLTILTKEVVKNLVLHKSQLGTMKDKKIAYGCFPKFMHGINGLSPS